MLSCFLCSAQDSECDCGWCVVFIRMEKSPKASHGNPYLDISRVFVFASLGQLFFDGGCRGVAGWQMLLVCGGHWNHWDSFVGI